MSNISSEIWLSNPLKSDLFHSWLWNYLSLRLKFSPQLGGFVSINSPTKGWKIHWKMLEITTIQRWVFPIPWVLQCTCVPLSLPSIMVQGQPLSDDLHRVILNMAWHLDVTTIQDALQYAPSSGSLQIGKRHAPLYRLLQHEIREEEGIYWYLLMFRWVFYCIFILKFQELWSVSPRSPSAQPRFIPWRNARSLGKPYWCWSWWFHNMEGIKEEWFHDEKSELESECHCVKPHSRHL